MTQQTISAKINPREPLHPQVKALFDVMEALRPAERILDAVVSRAGEPALVPFLTQGAPDVALEKEIKIPGPAGDIRALLFVPENPAGKALPLVLYIHGGGFIWLSPESHAKLTKQLAVGAGAIVVSIDYRLAPEHPYPEGLDDCVAAYRWLRANGASLGGDPARIAVGGDSAGGNLTAATTLRLLAEGDAPPEATVMICGWYDLAMETPSFETLGPEDPVIDDVSMAFYRQCYAPKEEQWGDALVSPLRGDVSAFPASCIVVGTIDPLCDDGIQLAAKLRAAGRDVVLQRYEGMPHDFMLFPGVDDGERCVAEMSAFLRERLAAS